MKRLIIPLVLFFLLVFEGVAISFLPDKFIGTDIAVVPHWVLIFLIIVSIFYDRESTIIAIIYGVVFGLLIDVVYTGVLGVYMFSYGIGIYVIHLLKRIIQTNIYTTIGITIVVISLVEVLLILIYSLVGMADVISWGFIQYRVIPTVVANLIILFVLYPIFAKRLTNWNLSNEL